MIRIKPIKYSVFGLACCVLLSFSSCRTAHLGTASVAKPIVVVKPITTGKLIRNIENNAFDYKHLSIKKITCQFDNGKTKTSFKASIFAEKDKRITVLLTKLNITMGRLWLTPDSVKFINYMEENYFLGDYNYLSSVLGVDLDFKTVNAIISNNIFSLRDEKHDLDNRDYETKIDSGFYVLESVTKWKAKNPNPKLNIRKATRKAKKFISDTPVHQSVYVDPETYKLRKIRMEDTINSRKLNISFSDFVAVDKQLYPGEIFFHFVSPESFMQLRIKLGAISTEEEKEIRFKVPEKYTRLNHN